MIAQAILEVFFVMFVAAIPLWKYHRGPHDIYVMRMALLDFADQTRADVRYLREAWLRRKARSAEHGAHRYRGDVKQWTISGLTERFANELKEWNRADQEAEQEVGARMSKRVGSPGKNARYAALARSGGAAGRTAPTREASQVGVQVVARNSTRGRSGSSGIADIPDFRDAALPQPRRQDQDLYATANLFSADKLLALLAATGVQPQ